MQNMKREKRQILFQKKTYGVIANEREVHLSREEFFTHLGRCISQSLSKEIKVMHCKGKRNGYKGLQRNRDEIVHTRWLIWNVYHPTLM